MPIFNPDIVAKELDKPFNPDRELRVARGQATDGCGPDLFYTEDDRDYIALELETIYASMTAGKTPSAEKIFYITTGGPGAGKTTLVRNLLSLGVIENAVHVDPDDVIKSIKKYTDMVSAGNDTDDARAVAYSAWRWASIFIANSIVNKLAEDGYDIVLGTTGTSPATGLIYQGAKDCGYTTKAIICHASEEVRLESVDIRFEKERRYINRDDVSNKGNVLFPNAAKIHFDNADAFDLYWREDAKKSPLLAASGARGFIFVTDQNALNAFNVEMKLRLPSYDWNMALEKFRSAAPKAGGASDNTLKI